jgi:hypothetical protein
LPPAERTGSILDRHPVAPPITITHERSITGALAEDLWEAYLQNVAQLAELAVQRGIYHWRVRQQHCYSNALNCAT